MFAVVAALVRKHNINILDLSSAVSAESFYNSPLQQVLSEVDEVQILTGDIPVESVDTLDIDFLESIDEDDGLFGDNEDLCGGANWKINSKLCFKHIDLKTCAKRLVCQGRVDFVPTLEPLDELIDYYFLLCKDPSPNQSLDLINGELSFLILNWGFSLSPFFIQTMIFRR